MSTGEFYPKAKKAETETETVSKTETVSVQLFPGSLHQENGVEYVLVVATDYSSAWWVPQVSAPITSTPVTIVIAEDFLPCYNPREELSEEVVSAFLNNWKLNFWLAGGRLQKDLQKRSIKFQVDSTRLVLKEK